MPTLGDWAETSKVLARLAMDYVYEQIRRGRLTNDAWIATTTTRVGFRGIPVNGREFAKLAYFCTMTWSISIGFEEARILDSPLLSC